MIMAHSVNGCDGFIVKKLLYYCIMRNSIPHLSASYFIFSLVDRSKDKIYLREAVHSCFCGIDYPVKIFIRCAMWKHTAVYKDAARGPKGWISVSRQLIWTTLASRRYCQSKMCVEFHYSGE